MKKQMKSRYRKLLEEKQFLLDEIQIMVSDHLQESLETYSKWDEYFEDNERPERACNIVLNKYKWMKEQMKTICLGSNHDVFMAKIKWRKYFEAFNFEMEDDYKPDFDEVEFEAIVEGKRAHSLFNKYTELEMVEIMKRKGVFSGLTAQKN